MITSGRQSRRCGRLAGRPHQKRSVNFLKPIFMQNFKKISPTENKKYPKHCERPSSKTKTATNLIITNLQTVHISFFLLTKKSQTQQPRSTHRLSLQLPHHTDLYLFILWEKRNHMETYQSGLSYVTFFLTECKALSLSRSIGFLTMKNKLRIWG